MKGSFFAIIATLLISGNCFAKEIKLTTNNVCSLEDKVDASTMFELKKCLIEKSIKRGNRRYPIYIYLNSPGGSIYQGLRFITFAKTIKNLHTITEFSASMSAAIVQGLPGKRYVVEHGTLMFHRASGTFRGQFDTGEVESTLKFWISIVDKMEKMQADRIGISLKEYKKRRLHEWWIYGQDNIKNNTADEVVTIRCSNKLLNSFRKESVNTIFGTFEYQVSDCPLVN